VSGATEPPSPVISVVTPCVTLLNTRLSIRTFPSDWPSMSMKPGATINPRTSSVSRAAADPRYPTAAMRSPEMATSPT